MTSPAITWTPPLEPPWSWKPLSRGCHHVLSQASEPSVRQSGVALPGPLRSSPSMSISAAARLATAAQASGARTPTAPTASGSMATFMTQMFSLERPPCQWDAARATRPA